MKAKLSISGNADFAVYLTPETEAERDILKRVAEQKSLTCYWNSDTYSRLDNQNLKIYPAPDLPKPQEPE